MPRNAIWRGVAFCLVMILTIGTPLTPIQRASAQDLGDTMTAGTLIAQVKNVIDELGNVGATLGGDFSITANQTATQLGSLLKQFTDAVGTNVTAPINSLGTDVLALGRKLQSVTSDLDSVLTHQRNCGVANGEVLIATLQNVALHLGNSIPFGNGGNPALYTFQFIGHDEEVVPDNGGVVVLKGYSLWTDMQPDVSLVDSNNRAIQTLPVSRGASDDQIQTTIQQPTLAAVSGQVVQFSVTTHQRKHFLFIPYGEMRLASFLGPAVAVNFGPPVASCWTA